MTDTRKCLLCTRNDAGTDFRCRDCHNRLVKLLRELEVYAVQLLPLLLEPVRGQTGRMSPGYGSKPPERLEVSAMLDPRTLPSEEDDLRSIPGSIARMADFIAEQRDETRPGGTLAADLDYVHRNLWWCGTVTIQAVRDGVVSYEPWIDDLAEDVKDLHRRARRLAGDAPQQPLGECLTVTCEGQVHEGGPGRPARCGACKRSYDGLDCVRLAIANERSVA